MVWLRKHSKSQNQAVFSSVVTIFTINTLVTPAIYNSKRYFVEMVALYIQMLTYINSRKNIYSGPKKYLDTFRYTKCMNFIVLEIKWTLFLTFMQWLSEIVRFVIRFVFILNSVSNMDHLKLCLWNVCLKSVLS